VITKNERKIEFHARALMTEAENRGAKPVVDGGIELWKFAGKEVIRAFDDSELILAGKRCNECFDVSERAVFVVTSMHEKFWLVALPQEEKVATVDRNSQTDQVRDALMFAPGAQTNQSSKTEACEQERDAREFRGKEIKRGTCVMLFSAALIVCAGAESRASKIESQNRNAESVQ